MRLRPAQIIFQLWVSAMVSPVGRRALPNGVCQISPRTTLDQQVDSLAVPGVSCLVQRCGMRVKAGWVVARRIFSSIQQEPDYLGATKLSCQRQRTMAIRVIGAWQ